MFNRRAPWHTAKYCLRVAILSISLVMGCGPALSNNREDLTEKLALIELPPGFSIELYAVGVPNARAMAVGSNGTLFVGSRSKGNVYGVVDTDHDHQADKVFIIAQNLRAPAGVAIWQQSLYVSAVNKILRFDNIEERLSAMDRESVWMGSSNCSGSGKPGRTIKH